MKGIISMTKKSLIKVAIFILLYNAFVIYDCMQLHAQVLGPQSIKWLRVSSLHQWFSSGGVEIEYGRRSRSQLTTDQLDGLNWPGEYTVNKGVNVGKSFWIGTTDFLDPVTNVTYPYKVVSLGRLNLYINSDCFPVEFSLIGRSEHPAVFVDDLPATDRNFDDELTTIDSNIPSDRMIVNKFHTTIGITVTRKILAFTQQYHDNYYVYEYEFVNTGIIDNSGLQKLNRTLTGVIFHWQHRYGFAGESYQAQPPWAPTGSSWGRNTINDAMGQDGAHTLAPPNDFRAIFSYYGPCATETAVAAEDIGHPNTITGYIMSSTNFAGVVVLHADRSPQDHSDDPSQPTTTKFMGSDNDGQTVNQYDASIMTNKYVNFMNAGHLAQTHADQIGKDANGWPTRFTSNWGSDNGGYSAAQGFGPYTMAPGDTIRIVVAEAQAGIMNYRSLVAEIAYSWFTKTPPPGYTAFPLPGLPPTTTTDRNEYKNRWVFTGKDSLFQTFRRAITNYNSNYSIPLPPPPPSEFKIFSGGNQILLTWAGPEAEALPYFDGYRIYRGEGKPDTMFTMIFECNKSNLVHSFGDRTARRGFNYYYYIVSKDDGLRNDVKPLEPLVSSKFYTMTNTPAFLMRPSGKSLSDIRIVPNPYNIKARDLQFGNDPTSADRLGFYNLPPKCIIKIYTETGDLIETINHTNNAGDELWHSLTSSRQLVASGLYIAYFEVTQDVYDEVNPSKLLIRKGDNAFQKFIIIR